MVNGRDKNNNSHATKFAFFDYEFAIDRAECVDQQMDKWSGVLCL